MNILYYCWNENSETDIMDAFSALGHPCIRISCPLSSYDTDPVFESQLQQIINEYSIDLIYTFNYFPILSKAAENNRIPYAAWVYDCPHLTLYSKTIGNSCNYLFLFDRDMTAMVQSLGAKHAFHLPLAVNTKRLNAQLGLDPSVPISDFSYDLSFVGSLYEQNMYNSIQYLPEYLRGYFEGLIASQQKIWGYSLLPETLNDTVIKHALQYIRLEDNPDYSFTSKDILINMLNQKITSEERIAILNRIGELVTPDIFTASDLSLIKNCRPHGFISYTEEMPQVFCHSKINLNISLRSITSGIPLRCVDILGAGGFLLTNYQPELAEYFVPDEDLVFYESTDDLLAKAAYYLEHDKERTAIAWNGWKKIQENFSYEKLLGEMLGKICL